MIASAYGLALAVVIGGFVLDTLWVTVGWVVRRLGNHRNVDDAASRRRLLEELERQP